jgi:uncharacterized integral membrane protein
LPEFWTTPTADSPEQARPLGWLLVPLALLGLMIVPRRLGARISRTGWGRTIAVHVFCLLVAGGIVLVGRLGSGELMELFGDNYTLSERLRLPAVLLVDALRGFAADVGDAYRLLAAIPAAHLLCWLIAWLLMPFIAAGERPGRAYLRAVKLVLWSACCFAVLMLIVLAVRVANEKAKFFDYVPNELVWPAVVGVWLLWWTGVLLRLGARYAGPAEGPGWTPRRPTCLRCGYQLTGLSTDGRCPECGLEVTASLPMPRALPQWAEARGVIWRLRRFLPTLWEILRRPQFFTTLAVYRGREAAVRFARWSSWLAGLWYALNATAPFVYERVTRVSPHAWRIEGAVIVLLTLVGTLLVCRLGGAVLALLACRFGWRDPRPTTIVTCYGGSFFMPLLLVLPLAVWIGLALAALFGYEAYLRLPHPYDYCIDLVLLLPSISPVVFGLVWGVWRFGGAVRAVRHASA